jgi:geranylgeranyl diphosphate synthase type I
MNVESMIDSVEEELRRVVGSISVIEFEDLYRMMAYHMGWDDEGGRPEARGKRIRPLLVLLCTAASGGEWRNAIPAAVAVELVHNFSLIHDDIQDNSPVRRGRPTIWKKWSIAQAINTGDAMFVLGQIAVLNLRETASPSVVLDASRLLQDSCLKLTQGQYLDLAYGARQNMNIDAYWPMIAGKTAALLSACTELGALVAGAAQSVLHSYRDFGHSLGLAFQVQDDLLGIWGDALITGKPAESDLVEGKKSLPVLFGLEKNGAFAQRWRHGPIEPDEVRNLAAQLEAEGARAYVEDTAARLTSEALQALREAKPQGEAGEMLARLVNSLLNRSG